MTNLRVIQQWAPHGAACVLVGLVLVAAGQPLFTDDAWLHLALGRAYAANGPWLAADPLLFTAPGPPTPSAWLFDIALVGLLNTAGFGSLRAFHVLCVGTIFTLAWVLLRRANGSCWVASLGTISFAILAAYRLVQLRPHLLSMLAALLLYWLCIEPQRNLSRGRMALGVGLLVCWANTHAAFLLGPLMLIAGGAGQLCAQALWPLESPKAGRRTGVALLALGLAGLLATALNPGLLDPHLAWFIAGGTTPGLSFVSDEWSPVRLLSVPVAGLPPSPLSWGLYVVLLAAAPFAAVVTIRAWALGGERAAAAPSPALVAIALGCLLAPMAGVRFLWLLFFPLLLLASTFKDVSWSMRWVAAGLAIALMLSFPRLGAWPMISRGVTLARSSYLQDYPASKYFGHAVWFLQDAGVRGRLFNEYSQGGFLGHWLAPEIRAFANGSLNLTPDAMKAYARIRARRGLSEGEGFEDLLLRHDVDLFLGTGLPVVPRGGRGQISTVGHLEQTPGWLLVFRSLRSAVYLRRDASNAANLERISAYYAGEGVPFDPDRGFEAWRAIEGARPWAIAHGVAPANFARLVQTALSPDRNLRRLALESLAAVYAGLGLYDRAADLESRVLRIEPGAFSSRRRLVWLHLRAGRSEEARDVARRLVDSPDPLSRAIAQAALEVSELSSEEAAARIALLPAFTPDEAVALRSMMAGPRVRIERVPAGTR